MFDIFLPMASACNAFSCPLAVGFRLDPAALLRFLALDAMWMRKRRQNNNYVQCFYGATFFRLRNVDVGSIFFAGLLCCVQHPLGSDITTVFIPPVTMLGSYCIQSLEKADEDFGVRHLRHGQSYIVPITAQMVLHTREGEFNRIEIGGVGRKKFASHSPL
jgi:hypothetical protein